MLVFRTTVAVLIAGALLASEDAVSLVRWAGAIAPEKPGWFVFLVAPLLAPLVSHPRSFLRAGLAIGLVVPLLALARFDTTSQVLCLLAILVLLVPLWRALGASHEVASPRIALSAVVIGMLLPLTIATLLSWPLSGRFELHRVWPTPHVAVAALALVLALYDLAARSGRAIVWLAIVPVAIATAPTLGTHSMGCVAVPGPLELLRWPTLVALLALGPWAGPAWRHLGGRFGH